MRGSLVLLTAVVLAAGPAPGADDSRPIVRAAAATATIGPRPPGAQLVRVPDLEFPLRIEPRCPRGLSVESLSISVADTRQTLTAQDFAAARTLRTTLRLDQRQIGPLALGSFCSAGQDTTAGPSRMRIRDALTASVSLRCADAARRVVSYASVPLEIELLCADVAAGPGAAAAGGDDVQESSSPMTRF